MEKSTDEKTTSIPGTELAFELGVPAELFLEGLKQRKESVLIGADPYSYLIFKLNLTKVEQGRLKMNSLLTVQLMVEGTLYSFKSNITNIVTFPIRLFFVEWPYTVQQKKLRKNERYSCAIPCAIYREPENKTGTIQNLARAGCHIDIPVRLTDSIRDVNIGEQFNITMQTEHGDITRQFLVRNKKDQNGILSLGGSFTEPIENIDYILNSSSFSG